MEKQIKSKARVADFGEVYTARKQVVDMVNMVQEDVSEIQTTVFEPACGDGNFLAEVLSRKLANMNLRCFSPAYAEWIVLQAVASIYGIDIQADNAAECRERLYQIVLKSGLLWSNEAKTMAKRVLRKNIQCGDTLTMKAADGTPLTISEWEIRENGTVIRKDVLFSEMIANGGESNNYIRRNYYRWAPEETRLTA